MATNNEVQNSKGEIKKANENSSHVYTETITSEINTNVKTATPTPYGGIQPPIIKNPPRPSQNTGLVGAIENKSIAAQTDKNHGLHSELQSLLNVLGDLKAKLKVLEERFETDCSEIIAHIKELFTKTPKGSS